MKKIKILLVLIVTAIGFNSCQEDDELTFVASEPAAFSFSNSFSSEYILTSATSTNLGERFTWNTPDFEAPTTITYDLERSITGDFSDAETLGTTSENEIAVTVGQLLELAMAAGLDNDADTDAPNMGDVFVRVRAYLGNGGLDVFSPIQTLMLVLPEASDETPQLPKLYVVGQFLGSSGYGSNWTATDAVPLAASSMTTSDFEGFVYMAASTEGYKFLPTNIDFSNDYGDDGTFTGILLQEGEVNCESLPEGFYLMKANTELLTYSSELTSWAITGNATPLGWPDNGVQDQDMTYNPDTKKWEITIALVADGNEFKFRANDGWDLNFGDDGGDGTLEYGAGNMSVAEAGTYLIELDLSNPRMYTYTATLQ